MVLRFRSARSTTATPPSGTGSGCWRCTGAIWGQRFEAPDRHANTVIPGRASSREPGIHNHESGLWIPGLRQRGASRNDEGLISMPPLAIAFPVFDPVAIAIGPLAIR